MRRRVANNMKSNGLNLVSRIKGIVKQGLGHLFSVFTTLSSSHFCNKTDLEQYLFPEGGLANAIVVNDFVLS